MKLRMNKKIFTFICIWICAQVFIFAEKITFSADSMIGSAKNDNSTTVLEGDAYILTESMEISGDKIELSGEDYRLIKAEGNIKGKNFDSGLEFTCGSLEYDRKTKIAVLKIGVNLEDTENAVKASAQIIEYNSETDIATLQIDVDLKQKDNICTAAYAVYHKKNQMLNLSGNAQIKQKEDIFRAQHITLDMNTEEITLDGRVKGTVSEKSEPAGEKALEGETIENKDASILVEAVQEAKPEAGSEPLNSESDNSNVKLESLNSEGTKNGEKNE